MTENAGPDDNQKTRELRMAARATVELFGNGAAAKTRERLAEVEAEGNKDSIKYWSALLEEVTRLHKIRHKF